MVKLSWPWWCALLSACAAWAIWRRWVAYNRRAFEFFLQRFEFHRAGGGVQKLSALDARLRQCALEGLENLPEERLQNFPGELDVTFSGGGFKNAYCLGVGLALEILQTQWQRGYVRRWSGASAGSMMALGAYRSQHSLVLAWSFAVQETLAEYKLVHPYAMWAHFWPIVASAGGVPPPGVLNLSVTKVARMFPWPRLEPWIVNDFESSADLYEALMSSACLPYVLSDAMFRQFRGHRVIDGAFTENTPMHEDHNRLRPQLVVRFVELDSATRAKLIYFSEREIVALCERGVADLVRLVEEGAGGGSHRNLHLVAHD